MKSTNQRVERLRQLLDLEERRSDLQQQLDSLTQQMHGLRDSLFDESSAGSSSPATQARRGRPPLDQSSSTPAPAGKTRGRKRRMKRGALREQIYAALHAAGDAGVRVTELAKAFTIKPVNIHSWFHSAIQRHPEIKKVQGGHYRLVGGSSGSSDSSQTAQEPATGAVKRGRGRPVGSAARKATPAAKSGQPSRRGQLSSDILRELEGAGAKGIHVRDLSEKINVPYKNIYIWFATTGKKHARVKKVSPGLYKLS